MPSKYIVTFVREGKWGRGQVMGELDCDTEQEARDKVEAIEKCYGDALQYVKIEKWEIDEEN